MKFAVNLWLVTPEYDEIIRWIGDNLTETTYELGRIHRVGESIIINFGSEIDHTLFLLRWG